MIKKNILYLLFILFIFGCKKEDTYTTRDYAPKFVVEGWIENGQYPHVILTHNLPFFTSVDSAQLSEIIIRYAKVSVSDGTQTEVLTGKKDSDYFPSFIYKGSELKGEVGKTYTLTIEYAGFVLTSETLIPKPTPLANIWFVSKGTDVENQQLNIKFNDEGAEKNYYKLYTKLNSDKRFIPTLLSNQDDKTFNGKELTLQVNRGPVNNLTIRNEPYFKQGDTVFVKFSSMPKEGFDFWSTFQDEVLNSSNPLIGSTGKIKSNIKGQGIGIWCGYSASIYRVIANPE